MKKILTFLTILTFCSVISVAQENRFSAGIELALPMSDFADAAGIGFGASLGYEIPLGEKAGVTGALGVLSFTGKDSESGTRGLNYIRVNTSNLMVPVQIGLKYYLMENQNGFYLGVQTGLHVISSKVEVETDTVFGVNTDDESDSNVSFGVAPGAGYHLDNVDIGLRYQILFEDVSTSYVGIRLAYVFGVR